MNTLDLNDLDIIEYGITEGFAYIVVRDYKGDHTLQACLKEGKKGFIKVMSKKDKGMDWGSCGDANEYLINKYGLEAVEKYFNKEARKLMGIRIA